MSEYKELEDENKKLRRYLQYEIRRKFKRVESEELWKKINLLIDNEIKLEGFCNE